MALTLTTTNNGDGTVDFAWSGFDLEALDALGTFDLYESTDGGSTWVFLASYAANVFSAAGVTVTGPEVGYRYKMLANVTTPAAIKISNRVIVTWIALTGVDQLDGTVDLAFGNFDLATIDASGYWTLYESDDGVTYNAITPDIAAATLTATYASPPITKYFYVEAYDSGDMLLATSNVFAPTLGGNAPVTSLSIDSATDDGTESSLFDIELSWTNPAGYTDVWGTVEVEGIYGPTAQDLSAETLTLTGLAGDVDDAITVNVVVLGETSAVGTPSAEATDSGTVAANSLQGQLVSGYNFALVADDITGSNSDPVNSWVGDGLTVAKIGTAPTLKTNAINGKQSVLLANTPMKGTLDSSITSPATYHIVYKPANLSGYNAFLDGEYDSGSGGPALRTSNAALYTFQRFVAGGENGFTAACGLEANRYTLLTFTVNGSSSNAWADGEAYGVNWNAGSNATLSKLVLGIDGGLGAFGLQGEIACVIGYSGVLNDPDREANEDAIISYYGMDDRKYTYTDVSAGGHTARVVMPVGLSAGTAGPAVVYFHGAGGGSGQISGSPYFGILGELASRGYRVFAVPNIDWGGQTSVDRVLDVYNALITTEGHNVNKTVFLAESAGGLTGLPCLSDATNWSQVEGFYGIYPVCNLADMYAGIFQGAIDPTYDIPGGGNYATQTAGHDPVLLSAALFTGKRLRFTASSGDALVSKTNNSDEMSTLVSGVADEYAVVTHTGNHGDASAFLASDVADFFDRCS